MNILEELATARLPLIADMIAARRAPSPSNEAAVRPHLRDQWDNKPAWDNWNQKAPPFKKKTVYFKKK